jgi:hypothetical protein
VIARPERTTAGRRVDSPPLVARKRDIKQFRQACKEVGLAAKERFDASEALHAEKKSGIVQADMSYGELLAWLRQWKG